MMQNYVHKYNKKFTEDMSRKFTKEKVQMINKHKKLFNITGNYRNKNEHCSAV